mgnify:CR=1 FL=1
MKRALLVTAIALALSACSSTKSTNKAEDPGSVTPVYAQKLSSNFKRKGIKLEFDCGTISSWTSGCNKAEPTAIEVTSYATSFGNSENNREHAFRVAEMNAKAKLRKFIHEDVATSETKQVISKNIEKANDRIKQRINANEEVNMTDDEATDAAAWQALATLPQRFIAPKLPLKAADLLALGVARGPALGAALRRAEAAWVAADFPGEIGRAHV